MMGVEGDILPNGRRRGLCRLRIWFLLFRFEEGGGFIFEMDPDLFIS